MNFYLIEQLKRTFIENIIRVMLWIISLHNPLYNRVYVAPPTSILVESTATFKKNSSVAACLRRVLVCEYYHFPLLLLPSFLLSSDSSRNSSCKTECRVFESTASFLLQNGEPAYIKRNSSVAVCLRVCYFPLLLSLFSFLSSIFLSPLCRFFEKFLLQNREPR